jgi:hypothetical protein
MPLVRSRQSISMVLLQSWLDGAPPGNSTETAWAPIAGDLVSAIGIDRPDAISVMARNNLQHLNISFEHALERAIENFERQPVTFVEARGRFPRGVLIPEFSADYQSSMLLMPERFPRLPESDGELVVMPAQRNLVWITGSKNEKGISALLDIAEVSFSIAAHRCSATLLRRNGKGWAVFRPEVNVDLQKKHDRVMRKQDALNYSQQKQALDRLHAARNEDVGVMDLIVDESDPQTRSVSVWPSGAEALLPKADVLALLEQVLDADAGRAVGTKRITTVLWEQATLLLSSLMEELPTSIRRAIAFAGFRLRQLCRASEGGLVRHLAQRVSNVQHGCLRTRLAIMSVHGLGLKFPRS